MDDKEFLGLAYESPVSIWETVEEDHWQEDRPDATALLVRKHPTYTEIMWIRSYPNARMISVTVPPVKTDLVDFPGVVTSLPVGARDCMTAQRFYERFVRTVASYEKEGWVRTDARIRTVGDA